MTTMLKYMCDDGDFKKFVDGYHRGDWSCYLVRSKVSPNRTYAGVTNDIKHRLRQHNGEISGGARATKIYRPWVLAAIVVGFKDDKRSAMRFEWFTKFSHDRPYVDRIEYKLPPREERISGICRRGKLFIKAYQKIKKNRESIEIICFDHDLGFFFSSIHDNDDVKSVKGDLNIIT